MTCRTSATNLFPYAWTPLASTVGKTLPDIGSVLAPNPSSTSALPPSYPNNTISGGSSEGGLSGISTGAGAALGISITVAALSILIGVLAWLRYRHQKRRNMEFDAQMRNAFYQVDLPRTDTAVGIL